MNKLIFVCLIIAAVLVGGCSSTKSNNEPQDRDYRNIGHDQSISLFLQRASSTDPRIEAKNTFNPDRFALMCFEEEVRNCPGGVEGVTTEMIRALNFSPIFIWGLTGPVVDNEAREIITKYMSDFNNTVLQIVFDGVLKKPTDGDSVQSMELVDLSSLYGTWKGIERFTAETRDEIGNVPYELFDEPEGEVELTIVLGQDLCTISKFDEPDKDCVYDHDQKLIVVTGGMYGSHYEPGYEISGFTGDTLKLNSILKHWMKKEDYSYTYFEFAHARLKREK